jgi:RimJ/RimL family protein N-acetyltransferase
MSKEHVSSVYLETERLILRRLTEDDVDNLFELDSDPEVMRYLNDGRTHTRDDIATKVLPHYLGHYARHGERYGFWAAIDKASGLFIGWFHFRPYRAAPAEIELGYRLRRSEWGKHYATEGSRGLIRKGFTEFGIEVVVADTLAGNARSLQVMEALGMHREGEFVLDADEFPNWDEHQRRGVKYRLTKSEWESSR